MEFTPRVRQILEIILSADEPLTKSEIAEKIGVSKRTVHREFEYLESDLKKYGLTIETRKGKGTQISGPTEALLRLQSDVNGSPADEIESKEERRKHLLFELLRDRTPRKLYYYGNILGVSEATAGTDMDALEPWLAESHLKIVRRPGFGVILEGSERDYREAMRRLINEMIVDGGTLSGRIEQISSAIMEDSGEDIYSLLNKNTVEKVDRVLREMKEERLEQLTEEAFAGLVVHISISIERISQGGLIQSDETAYKDLECWEGYDLARKILRTMERAFSIEIPDAEIVYVLLHLRGAKIAYSGSAQEDEELGIAGEKLYQIMDEMIERFDPSIAYDLRNDEEFLHGLIVHLRPAIFRLQNHMAIYNPILEDIKKEYAEVYRRCESAATVLERELNLQVSPEEIAFLAMHFGAAKERIVERRSVRRKVNVGVVCASGFGVARLMMTKLRDQIGSGAVLKAYGKEEVTPYVVANTDFFVSTMDLSGLQVDFVQVSPLIAPSDIKVIRYKINDYAHLRRKDYRDDFDRNLDAVNLLTREIKGVVRRYRKLEVKKAALGFEDLLRFMSMQIAETQECAMIIKKAIEEREALNTQVFPELGICLFHCRSRAVQDILFVTCTPPGNRCFENPFFKGCRTAVLMVMPIDDQREMHSEVLGQISAAFITNATFLERVKYGSEEDVREELSRELKDFFFRYLDRF